MDNIIIASCIYLEFHVKTMSEFILKLIAILPISTNTVMS